MNPLHTVGSGIVVVWLPALSEDKLKTFADTFAGDANFDNLMQNAGLSKRPEALAALLQGCDGDASKLAKVCETFKDKDDAKNLETALGSSLGRDQSDAEESHLRGGEIGKWATALSEEDLRFVQARLSAYSLDLADFRTEPAK